mmetsp:Transcript_146838/g.471462  ORF Transcript_146838/g.471462 Transcript_146838/m.471462 type:complete len:477 (-) Transcript_146838:41-1471(-)
MSHGYGGYGMEVLAKDDEDENTRRVRMPAPSGYTPMPMPMNSSSSDRDRNHVDRLLGRVASLQTSGGLPSASSANAASASSANIRHANTRGAFKGAPAAYRGGYPGGAFKGAFKGADPATGFSDDERPCAPMRHTDPGMYLHKGFAAGIIAEGVSTRLTNPERLSKASAHSAGTQRFTAIVSEDLGELWASSDEGGGHSDGGPAEKERPSDPERHRHSNLSAEQERPSDLEGYRCSDITAVCVDADEKFWESSGVAASSTRAAAPPIVPRKGAQGIWDSDDPDTPPRSELGDGTLSLADMNQGSLGHPELCSRPCLYFASGSCSNGRSCDYCHLPHSRRLAHLDRRHRELLRSKPLEVWAALVLPIVNRRVEGLVESPWAADAMGKLATLCRIPTESLKGAAPHRTQRMLSLSLKSLRLRTLLAEGQRYLSEHCPEAEAAMEQLMQSLRRFADEKQGVAACEMRAASADDSAREDV